ncbi:MAG: ABC transporter ATP-binding protein [Anaerolineaceae bacterium]|nr:ABC transporter ATP-binding protein [Anaerolineaceae bacterium]
MKRVFGHLWRSLRPYRGISAFTLLLITAQIGADLMIPRLIQRIIDSGVRHGNLSVVLQTSALMIGLSLLSCALAVGSSLCSIRVSEGIGRDLRKEFFLKVQSFSYGNLDRYSTGQLMVRISSDVSAMQRLVHMSLRMGAKGPLMMTGSVVMMFLTAPQLAVWVVPVMFLAMGVVVYFSMRMEPAFRTVQEKLDRLNTVLQENIAGAELVKSFDRADFEEARFEESNQAFTSSSIRVMQFMAVLDPFLTFTVNLAIVVIIWAGGLQSISGSLSPGTLVAFVNYMLAVQVPLLFMITMSNNLANGLASGKRVCDLLDEPAEVAEADDLISLNGAALGECRLDRVAFSYHDNPTHQVLEDINLRSEPGQMIAILGATGAGKSSLVNLIPRFYDPHAGQVLVNGIDLRRVKQSSLLARIGVVAQESILFSGSIRDNLRYGRPNASDAEVEAAAKAAQIHAFIQNLPDGYETHIEQRGANLSGGQKQRMAIARALLVQADYLILDDSTSAVDVETEAKIQQEIRQIMRGKTIFMVAQRISTVLNADKIIVLDHGRIAAEGSHQRLMLSSPIYREIFESQLGSGAGL